MRLSCHAAQRGGRLGLGGAAAEELFDARNVGGNVDFDAFVRGGFAHGDAVAVFQPAKLFELLEALEFAGRERGKIEKSVAAKRVDADVLEMARGDALTGVANPGDGRTGKIEGVAVEVGDHFDDVGIHDVFRRGDGDTEGGNLGLISGGDEGVDDSVDDLGRNERKITLKVDVDVRRGMHGDFSEAIGAGAMLGAGHDDFAVEGFDGGADARVVGGDDDARGTLALLGALVDVLNHGAAGDRGERLSRETGRSVPRGNHDDDVRL